jgi:hypothetical protein
MNTIAEPRNIGRSALAVVAGIIVNFVALPIDQLFHVLEIYPPWGVPMTETSDNLLALAYRTMLAVASGWVTARLAPSAPMKHALVLGGIGTVLLALGLVGAMQMEMGPLWYPALLVVIALPAAWLGARLYRG